MTQERKHALLSASAAERWLHCAPAPRMEEKYPETESSYANEGRLAHEIGELKLRKAFVEPMRAKTFNNRLKKLKENPAFKEEMLKHTDMYLDYISGIMHSFKTPPYIAAEKRVNYSAYAPEGFGTCDCMVIGNGTLYVNDFKYGRTDGLGHGGTPVSAENNPQMMLYALGAYTESSFLFPIERIVLSIIQPNLDAIPFYEMSVADLLAWGESIKPIALKAFNGEGEFVPGDHCCYCRIKALCRARTEMFLNLEGYHCMKPPLISNAEVGQILVKAQNLAKWVESLEEYALAEILKGIDVPGWKAVHGRSKREFTDTDAAFKVLTANGTEEVMLYKREPLTLAKVEELIGKKNFKDLLSAYVNTLPGKPTLALLSDKRQAITLQTTAEQAFGKELTAEEIDSIAFNQAQKELQREATEKTYKNGGNAE